MAQTARERGRARRPQRALEERDRPEEGSEDGNDTPPAGGAVSQLRGVMSEAAVTVLSPVAKRLATRAAKMAVERGPELIEDTILPKLQSLGGALGGDDAGGGRAGDGTGKGRRMPIQQSVDVAAPLDVVYDQWTQFEDYPKFMHRVERVEQRDDAHVVFHEKIWGVRRHWEAEIVEQQPDERIVWKTVSGMQHVGVVTFHELSDRLTRIELNLDLEPEGPIEKLARGARFAKRAARADLKRFKAFVEMRDDETGAWRGTIEEAEVVDDEEPEAYEDEDNYEDEEEEEAERSRRAPAKGKTNGGRASQATSRSRGSARTSRAKASSGKRTR